MIKDQVKITHYDDVEQLKDFFKAHRGQHMITPNMTIERLVALGTDETDYYWVFFNGRKLSYIDVSSDIIEIKDQLYKRTYKSIIRNAEYDHLDQPKAFNNKIKRDNEITQTMKEFNEKFKKDIESLKSPIRYITNICWDLN